MKQNKKSNHHFNAYYQDNALLIQFIILEFVGTNQVMDEIELLENQCSTIKTWKEFAPLLSRCFHKLLGSFSIHEGIKSSPSSKGHLTKLKYYSGQFSRNESDILAGMLLHEYVHEVWLCALQNIEFFGSFQYPIPDQMISLKIRKIKRSLKRLRSQFKYTTKQIPKLIQLFKDNENVVFFLYRKKEELTEVFGEDFLTKIMKDQVKKEDLFQQLLNRYSNRGFADMMQTMLS